MSTYTYPGILKSVYRIMSNGGQFRAKDLLPLVQQACGLTDEQMQERTKGETSTKVKKLVQWALTHLYGAGLTNKVSRGLYEIAPQKEHLLGLSEMDLEDLVRKIYNNRKTDISDGYTAPDLKTIEKVKKLIPSLKYESNDWRLQLCFLSTAPDKQSIITGLTTLLADAKDSGYEIDLDEILKKVDEELNKKYELVLEIITKGPDISKVNIYIGEVGCKKEELIFIKLEPQPKSIYLSFLYEGSIGLWDFCNASKSEGGTYRKIYLGMPGRKIRKEDITPIRNGYEDDDEQLNQMIAKINKAISEALGNDRIARQFTITKDIDDDSNYIVKSTNQYIKDTIKKHFRLK